MSDSPVVLATRYLVGVWRKHTGIENDTPPLDLTGAVVQAVTILGYQRKTVDNIVESYIKKEREVR